MYNKRKQIEKEETLLSCNFALEKKFIIIVSVVVAFFFLLSLATDEKLTDEKLTAEKFVINLITYVLVFIYIIVIPNFLLKKKQLFITNQRIESIFDLGAFYYNVKDYRFDTIHDVYLKKNIIGINTIVILFDNGQSVFNQSLFSHSFKKLVLKHVENADDVLSNLLSIAYQTKNNIDYFGEILEKNHKDNSLAK